MSTNASASPKQTLAGLIRDHAETIAALRHHAITDIDFATYLSERVGGQWEPNQIVREIQRQRWRARERVVSDERREQIETLLGTHPPRPSEDAAAAPPASPRSTRRPPNGQAPAKTTTGGAILPASSREDALD